MMPPLPPRAGLLRLPLLLLSLLCLLPGRALLAADAAGPLPRLVDYGAGKCIPCKQMKPILEALTKSHSDQFTVVFIDVWENKDAGSKNGIRMIPTQVFYAADGRELARHEGFMSRKDILAKWRELGVDIREPAVDPAK